MSARAFSPWQAMRIKEIAHGRCQLCKNELSDDWHADHIIPWSLGGLTVVSNGQALCSTCNQQKGNKMPDRQLREVQKVALEKIAENRERGQRLTVLHYGVGSGKTLIELADAYRHWVNHGQMALFVVPTEALRDQLEDAFQEWEPVLRQWYGASRAPGIRSMPDRVGLPGDRVPFGILTYTLLTSSTSRWPEDIQRWAESHRGQYNLYGDEAQFLGIDKQDDGGLFAKKFERLHYLAAHTVLMTGTPERADGRDLVLCRDHGKYLMRQTPDGSGMERLLMPDEKAVYSDLLSARHLVAFEGESIPAERPIVVETTYAPENGDPKGKVVKIEYETIDQAVEGEGSYTQIVRMPEVWTSPVDRAISRFVGLQEDYRAASAEPCLLIIGADQDTCEEIKKHVDSRSQSEGLGLITRLAISDLPRSREKLREFRKDRNGNVLITCKMAYIGFDCPSIKVIAYCGNALTEERLVQTFGRGARVIAALPHEDQYCYWYAPKTVRMDKFIDRLNSVTDDWRRMRGQGTGGGDYGPSARDSKISIKMQEHGDVTTITRDDSIRLQQSDVQAVEQMALEAGIPVAKMWKIYQKMQGKVGSEKGTQDAAVEPTVEDDGGVLTSTDRKNWNQKIQRAGFRLLHQVHGDDRGTVSREYAQYRGKWNGEYRKVDDLVTNGEARRYMDGFLSFLMGQLS